MTYAIQSLTTLAAIQSAFLTFAGARGWGVAGNVITNPVSGAAITVDAVSANQLQITLDGNAARQANSFSPVLNVGGAMTTLTPVTAHMFGNNAPYAAPDTEPFLALIIEYGGDHFRHVYIGGLVKIGNYTDGDVISCNNWSRNFSSVFGTVDYNSVLAQRLFGGRTAFAAPNGGALITHADNPQPWRAFDAPTGIVGQLWGGCTGVEIVGGNGDGPNDGLTHRSAADYAAAQVLVPCNLYGVLSNQGSDNRVVPFGHVSGLRLCSMRSLVPTQQYSVAGDLWRCFPELRKDEATVKYWQAGEGYWTEETSHYYGVAYREDT